MPATTSPGPKRRSGDPAYWRSVATAPACVWMALLGRPLVPLVLSRSAIASGSPPSAEPRRRRAALPARAAPRSPRRPPPRGPWASRPRRRRVARARLAQEGSELAGREQRAGGRQREPGEQGAVGDDRKPDAVARHQGEHVAVARAAGPQAAGQPTRALGDLAVGRRPAGRSRRPARPGRAIAAPRRAPPRAASRGAALDERVRALPDVGHRPTSIVCRNPADIYAGSLHVVKERCHARGRSAAVHGDDGLPAHRPADDRGARPAPGGGRLRRSPARLPRAVREHRPRGHAPDGARGPRRHDPPVDGRAGGDPRAARMGASAGRTRATAGRGWCASHPRARGSPAAGCTTSTRSRPSGSSAGARPATTEPCATCSSRRSTTPRAPDPHTTSAATWVRASSSDSPP